jgi:hypothetical protein
VSNELRKIKRLLCARWKVYGKGIGARGLDGHGEEKIAQTRLILRTWGAAVLRPYTEKRRGRTAFAGNVTYAIFTRLFPGAEEAAEEDQGAEVVGVVIGDEQGFAENGLPIAVRERSEQVGGFILDELDHGF